MRVGRLTLVALLLLLSFVPMSQAQETTGTLTGRVRDSQGLALPGATVTVTGPQGARSIVTDQEGRFRASFLTPGSYDVSVELSGFRAISRRGIVVSLGQTVEVPIELSVGGIAETVEVTSESSPVIDTTRTTTGDVLSSELLARVPIGRTFADAVYLAPGVAGTGTGRFNPSISGGSGLDNQYVVDGVNVTNSGYGALGSYSIVFGSLGNATPFDFVKEIQVKTGGYEAEFGQSIGGVVNVVTKSGSNDFRGSLFGYGRFDALEGDWKQYQSVNGSVQTVGTEVADAGVEVGGPVFRDRLFFFAAVNPSWNTRTLQAPEGFPLESLGSVDQKRNTLSYSAKATFQAGSNHRVDASFFGDPSEGKMGPQRLTSLLRETTSGFSSIDEYGGHNQTVRYDGILAPTWLVEVSFARAKNTIAETPAEDTWSVRDFRVTPNVFSGGIGFYEKGNDSENLQFKVKSTHIFAGHTLAYGAQFEDVTYSQINQRTGPVFTTPDGRETATGAQVYILPDPVFGQIYRVNRANFNTGRETTQKYWNFFIQDSWKVTDRLTINPGIRYEQQSLSGTIVKDFELKNNWAPRIGVIFDVAGNGRSKLYGNWGRYYARIPNDLAARALSADDSTSRADYFDADLTQPIPDGVLAGDVTDHYQVAGLFASEIDPDAKLSYKDEFVVGFEYEVWQGSSLGIRYIHRNIGRVIEDVAAFPMVGYDLGLEGADSVEYILTNPKKSTPTLAPELGAAFEEAIHDYDAVEVTFDRRFSNNWQAAASYRWSRLHGTFEGFFREDNGQSDPGITSLYDFPTNDPSYTAIGVPQFGYRGDIRYLGELGKGPLPLDRPHQIKLSGNYSFPWGLSLGPVVTFSSGKPLTPFAANPNYTNAGEIPEAPRGSGIQTIDGFKERTPFESQVDLQAAYQLQIGRQRITLLADFFNLFNQRSVRDYDNFTEISFGEANPDFGKPITQNIGGAPPQFQAPFALRLGARFEW